MAHYMLLEVSIHGIDLPHDEVLKRMEHLLNEVVQDQPFGEWEVECVEHAGSE